MCHDNYDIVLINPSCQLIGNYKVLNAGLHAIEAYLVKYGYKCCIISHSEIDRYAGKAEIFGISVMDHSYEDAQIITHKLKNKIVIWGGWTATASPKYILTKNKDVDYIVIQEGEYRLIQLLQAINQPKLLVKIDGIAYRGSDKNIIINQPQKFVDMNELPIAVTPPVISNMVYIEISRGCYGRCNYCQEVSKMRFKKADNILDEIDYWYQKLRNNFYFGNANSLANGQLLNEIIDTIEYKQQYVSIHLVGRPDDIIRNEKILEKIFKSSCIHLSGIETGIEANTEQLLHLLGRSTTPQINYQAMEILLSLKRSYSPKTKINANIILFSHFDMTLEDFKENILFIGDYGCSRDVLTPQLYGMANTPIWKEMQQRNFKPKHQFGRQICQYEFSDKLVNQLFIKLIKQYPLYLNTKQKKVSAESIFDFRRNIHDKVLDFYYAPNVMNSILNFIQA